MQFYQNGFRPGDPDVAQPLPDAGRRDTVPDEVDVLIVGCGPAGLTLAAQMAAFPDIRTAIVERKDGPLDLGQADGVACRSMEMFNAFGFAERLTREAYWVNEVAFWKPDPKTPGGIFRSGRIQDVEEGLSEFPHVILNQARVHQFYLDVMRNSPSRMEPYYGREITDLAVGDGDGPVTVTLSHGDRTETVRAKYVVGCDGARSTVRRSIGRSLKGDSANQAWGVMDILAVTDFPDMRLKCAIHSDAGNAVLIPREGGYLVRLYIELDKLAENERVASRNIDVDYIIKAAQRIFAPYTLDVKEVAWWSVYEIGQRLCDRFDDVEPGDGRPPRVFIAGDACHTHSPKAGQGMNVSMRDTFNLGWKLAAVLRGRADPKLLLTYSAERQAVAQELIDFDRELAAMFSRRPKSADHADGVDPAEFQRYFQKQGRFTAGTAIRYAPSVLTGDGTHQSLARGLVTGERFHSAPVIRLGDAKPMHLGHAAKADGVWRLYVFADAGDPTDPDGALWRACDAVAPVIARYTPDGVEVDGVIDLRAVMQQTHRALDYGAMHPALRPAKGKYGMTDYEKVFCVDPKAGDIFDMRGIDRGQGCMVLVRPDQHVATVLPLDGAAALDSFIGQVLHPA